MSWRPGELWLDTEVSWFRESGVPALAGFTSSWVPTLGPPPGLVASRQRRAVARRRKYARRARATALALSPAAAIIPFLAHRGNGDGARILAADPPTLTFHAPAVPRSDVHDTVDFAPLQVGSPRVVARAGVEPRIAWHHATSVGLPYDGRLIDGTQLPLRAPNWVTWNPVTDSVPNAADRVYGNEHTIRTIISVIDAYRAAHPEAPRVVVGDVSREGGGPMTDEHVSHQNGLDVDIYYPRTDRALSAPTSPDEIDERLSQDLVDRFVAAGAQMIFVGFSTNLHGPAGVVIPYPNHDDQMHVRFAPPSG